MREEERQRELDSREDMHGRQRSEDTAGACGR